MSRILLLIAALSPPPAARAAGAADPVPLAWEPSRATAGVTLSLEEIGRDRVKRTPLVVYRVHVPGLDPERLCDLWNLSALGEPILILRGVTAGPEGILVCAADLPEASGGDTGVRWCDRPGQPVTAGAVGHAAGEAFRVGLVSWDGRVRAFARAHPEPIEARAGSCALRIELLSPRGDAWSAEGAGFPPGEAVGLEVRAGTKRVRLEATADVSGGFAVPLVPSRLGFPEGSLHLSAVSAACAPSLRFRWGAGAVGPR